jgi:hypothetical protein
VAKLRYTLTVAAVRPREQRLEDCRAGRKPCPEDPLDGQLAVERGRPIATTDDARDHGCHRKASCDGVGGGREHHHAERDVERRARDEGCLETDQGQQHEARQNHAGNGAECIDAVNPPDGGFAASAREEHLGDQWQRGARTGRRRQHDGETDRIAPRREADVSRFGGVERAHRVTAERVVVEGQRGQRGHPHHELDDAERPERMRPAVGAAAHPERPESQAQDERRQHGLERVRGAPQEQRQHPDPGDLVEEGRDRGARRHGQHHGRRAEGRTSVPRRGRGNG